MKLSALFLPGLIFVLFSTAHSSSLSRFFCSVSMSLLFTILPYVMQSSATSLLLDTLCLRISLTWARSISGPNTLSCSTPDIVLTSTYCFAPTLNFCVRPKNLFVVALYLRIHVVSVCYPNSVSFAIIKK